MFELVVVWESGETDVYKGYSTEDAAQKAGDDMKKALGNQISWYGTRKGV